MPIKFVRVRIPGINAEWDAPETALKAHAGLVPLDKPPANPPASKPRRALGEQPRSRRSGRDRPPSPRAEAATRRATPPPFTPAPADQAADQSAADTTDTTAAKAADQQEEE